MISASIPEATDLVSARVLALRRHFMTFTQESLITTLCQLVSKRLAQFPMNIEPTKVMKQVF